MFFRRESGKSTRKKGRENDKVEFRERTSVTGFNDGGGQIYRRGFIRKGSSGRGGKVCARYIFNLILVLSFSLSFSFFRNLYVSIFHSPSASPSLKQRKHPFTYILELIMKGGAGGGVNLIRELRDVFTRIVVYIYIYA